MTLIDGKAISEQVKQEIAYEKKPQGVGRHDAVGCRQSIR